MVRIGENKDQTSIPMGYPKPQKHRIQERIHQLKTRIVEGVKTIAESIRSLFGRATKEGALEKRADKVQKIADEKMQSDVIYRKSIHQVGQKNHTYMAWDQKVSEEYQQAAVLGEGSYGKVLKVVGILEDCRDKAFAIKEIKSKDRSAIRNELYISKLLNQDGPHPGIQLELKKVQDLKKRETIGAMAPLYQEDYWDRSQKRKATTDEIYSEFHQLLNGLSHCHAKDVLHGDIKPENILCRDTRVDLADFGGSIHAKDSAWVKKRQVFTPGYVLADDVYARKSLTASRGDVRGLFEKRDVFALGIVFFMRLTKQVPYPKEDAIGLIAKENNFLALDKIKTVDPGLIDLIKMMLEPDYTKRPTAKEALELFKGLKLDETLSRP